MRVIYNILPLPIYNLRYFFGDLTPISVRCVGRVGICPPAMITTSGTTSTTSCSTEKYSQLKIKFGIFIKHHKTVWIGGFLI